ncbi:MAG: transketolase family protein [Candidatus Vogelbacteria bacterium]|nr:transketolase family protein [Candidatus Vogelbacteria bacterium]
MSSQNHLTKEQKLNSKLFELSVEQVPIRSGFGEGLVLAADEDRNIVGLCADLVESTKMLAFAEKYPERFIELGVAEQNLAGVASGLAAMGKIPFITSYAMFSPGRNWEQIRTTITYNNRPVKIVGSHAGVSVGPDGGTHQALEDIAIMRVLPRMMVVVPCDALEANRATRAIAKTNDPTYLRLAREKTPIITTNDSLFKLGQANMLWEDEKPAVVIIACGPLVYNALQAARKLLPEGVGVTVINNHTIKPLDNKTILSEVKRTGAVVTVEEHQQAGGLGSAVAELLATNYPVPMEFVGVKDEYGQSGTPAELIEKYELGTEAIIEAVQKVLTRK